MWWVKGKGSRYVTSTRSSRACGKVGCLFIKREEGFFLDESIWVIRVEGGPRDYLFNTCNCTLVGGYKCLDAIHSSTLENCDSAVAPTASPASSFAPHVWTAYGRPQAFEGLRCCGSSRVNPPGCRVTWRDGGNCVVRVFEPPPVSALYSTANQERKELFN